jgi:hypothetical protein
MKTLILLLWSLTLGAVSSNAQLMLEEGDVYDFVFPSLSLEDPAAGEYGWDLSFTFAGDLIIPTDSLQIDLYEDTITGLPFASTSPVGLPLGANGWGFAMTVPTSDWNDLQGAIRFSMLSGSAGLASIQVSKYLAGDSYTNTFVVPEPEPVFLITVGLLAILMLNRKMRTDRWT